MIKGFKMKLYNGLVDTYKERHNQLWQEMIDLIHQYGGSNYSIFHDEETNILFGYIEIQDENLWNTIGETAMCKKWWEFMADIMETNEDLSPVSTDLNLVFHLD